MTCITAPRYGIFPQFVAHTRAQPKGTSLMVKIGIILGTTRPGRVGAAVADWVLERARARDAQTEYELVDLADYPLPHLDEPVPAARGQYSHQHTKRWASKVGSFDGYIFVTPEYNRSIPGVLKNALDYVGPEWNNKAAGIVSYGGIGGARAAEHLRSVLSELRVAPVREQVMLSVITEFKDFHKFTPVVWQIDIVNGLLDQVTAWSVALQTLRAPAAS